MNDLTPPSNRSVTGGKHGQTTRPSSVTAGRHARVIAVTSGKGGVGKSNLAANLSIALARKRRAVCLFDADTNLANVNILLGLTPDLTLEDFLKHECSLEQILITGAGGIQVVPAASGIAEFVHLNPELQNRLLDALQRLEQRFDYLVIDTAAGIDDNLIQFLLAAPHTLLTITPEPTSLADAFALLKVLKRFYFDRPVYVVINMVSGLPAAHDAFKRLKQAAAKFLQLEIRYLGYVLMDENVPDAVQRQRPVLLQRPAAPASKCLNAIADRLWQFLEESAQPTASFSDFFRQLGVADLETTDSATLKHPMARHRPPATPGEKDRDMAIAARAESTTGVPEQTLKTAEQTDRAGLLAGDYYAQKLGSKEAKFSSSR